MAEPARDPGYISPGLSCTMCVIVTLTCLDCGLFAEFTDAGDTGSVEEKILGTCDQYDGGCRYHINTRIVLRAASYLLAIAPVEPAAAAVPAVGDQKSG